MQARTAPRGQWLLGHHPAFFADPLSFIEVAARDHGDLVPLRFGPIRAWLVSDPALIGEVFGKKADGFRKDIGLRRTRVILGHGLLTSEGAVHARRARIALPAFAGRAVAAYGDAMVEVADRVIDQWTPGGTIDVSKEMSRMTLAIAGRTLFGADLLDGATAFGEAFTELLTLLDERVNELLPIPLGIPTAKNRRFNAVRAVLDDTVNRVIRDRRAGRTRGDDLLQRLMHPAGDGAQGLTDEELRDEVMTLLLAGHETTANALAFAFWLLARHPDALAKVREEVERVLGDRPPVASDLGRLPETLAVFQETLRLFPPAWVIGREAARSVELGAGDEALRLGCGNMVLLSPWVLHRHPRHWDAPDAFRPSRFAPGAPRPRPYTYFPFGGGKRACIGRSFALLEAVLLIARIVQRTDLGIEPEHEPERIAQMTLRPGPIPATVRPRHIATAQAIARVSNRDVDGIPGFGPDRGVVSPPRAEDPRRTRPAGA